MFGICHWFTPLTNPASSFDYVLDSVSKTFLTKEAILDNELLKLIVVFITQTLTGFEDLSVATKFFDSCRLRRILNILLLAVTISAMFAYEASAAFTRLPNTTDQLLKLK
ncbi:hypothetical protein BC833DRAFT_626378 [Globomyces pollinis-pini]|nr:hypothetical protein BC833DRAFT_626378 [Globomyces pollinis-pini]